MATAGRTRPLLFMIGVFLSLLAFGLPRVSLNHGIESSCPVDNRSNCVCSYGDITCRHIDSVPRFPHQDVVYRTLDLSNQKITKIPSGIFSKFKVKKILLNNNPLGGSDFKNAFIGVNKFLEELWMGDCDLASLNNNLLVDLEVKILHLWNNKIHHLPNHIFRYSKHLEELYLWGNRIETLHENTFSGLGKLRRLDLDNNYIKLISNLTLRHMPHLEVLHLAGNDIPSVPNYSFVFFPRLKVLNLEKNGLKFLNEHAFYGLGHLIVLGLQNNQIELLAANLFNSTIHLRILWLHNNRLQHVWERHLQGLVRMQQLFLQGNVLKDMNRGIFHKMTDLRILRLDNNNLTKLEQCMFSNDMRVKSFSVDNNPIQCDCSLSWIMDLLDKGTTISGTCAANALDSFTHITNPLNFQAAKCPTGQEVCK